MVQTPRSFALCGLLALCSFSALSAGATTFTQSGIFTDDYEVLQFQISTTTTQTYHFDTTSYSGGTNANGTTTKAGGFDPVLSLFNANGTIFTGDAASNGGSDASLTDVLNPGTYTLALTEFPNYSNGTLTSFLQSSMPSDSFVDPVTGKRTTANYTVNYTSNAVTPEPPSALLLLLPLAGIPFLVRKQKTFAAF